LIGSRRRPINHRRQAASVLQDRTIVLRKYFLRCEAGEMDHAPEAIASSSKMMPNRGRRHSGIDPAEDHSEAFGDDVREGIDHDMIHRSRNRPFGARLTNPPAPTRKRA